ncbi:MAG: hypothetical protein L0Z55_03550 [Planctomycetes bacterium]|nr:hypothetical protein [Planctomycetota bacterium]
MGNRSERRTIETGRCGGKRRRAAIASAALLCFFPAKLPSAADQLLLKNGNILDGRVERQPDGAYRVQIEEGNQVTVPAGDVEQWIRGPAPIDEFEARFATVDRKDYDALVELAAWSEERGLVRSARLVFRAILELDPHHAGARDRLGYVLYRNRWVSRAELERRGLVRYRGVWLAPDEIAAIRAGEAVAEFRALLADAHHDNRYLRENALTLLFALDDERLFPSLIELLPSDDPLDRMIAARVLGNFDFEPGGDAIYRAYLRERHDEVGEAMRAVLRAFGDARLGEWMGRDLANWRVLEDEPAEARSNLLALAILCPHRAVVPPLLAELESAETRGEAERTLIVLLGRLPPEAGSWREHWRALEPAMAADLGRDWIRDRTKERGRR